MAADLDDVGAVVVQVPQLAVVALVGPPEGVLLQQLQHKPVSAVAPGTMQHTRAGYCTVVALHACMQQLQQHHRASL